MKQHYDIVSIIDATPDRAKLQDFIGGSEFFDSKILTYYDNALLVWRRVARRYANKEQEYAIPYRLAESVKLYAVDALCIARPLVEDDNDLLSLAEFFTIFYLIVHFFDDHVEHRDKFYSKFDFSVESNIDTQRGAAPFSFMLVSLGLLDDVLSEVDDFTAEDRHKIINKVYEVLAIQARYFAAERQSNLDLDEILEVKQRRVSGRCLAFLGEVLSCYLKLKGDKEKALYDSLLYLGSLTQITDDIRDYSIDTTLRNANILVTAHHLGRAAGNKKLEEIYAKEAELARINLLKNYDAKYVKELLSLPFYPFMVDKQRLQDLSV